jgi:hypothetical protein
VTNSESEVLCKGGCSGHRCTDLGWR